MGRRNTKSIKITMSCDDNGHPYSNLSLVKEKKLQFRYYTDDMQKEAKEYAEASKPI
jgi:hypothetical protein